MRKIKKINGFLVVKFNDREKREYEGTALGEYGVIDAEVYTGNLDIDRGAMEYDDADTLEVAVELARGLESEEDITDEPPTYTAAVETNESYTEETVEPAALIEGWTRRLATQVKSKHYPDTDPRTAAHELYGFKMALHQIGFLPESEVITDPDTFGAGRLDGPMPRNPEELLAFVCDERCKNRAGHTQEELDAICAKCPLGQLYEDAEAQDLRIRERSERALREHIEGVRRAEDTVTALLGGHEALAYLAALRDGQILQENECEHYAAQIAEAGAAWETVLEGVSFEDISRLRHLLREVDEHIKDGGELFNGFRHETERIPAHRLEELHQFGTALLGECPENDCTIYRNVFRISRSSTGKSARSRRAAVSPPTAWRPSAGSLFNPGFRQASHAIQGAERSCAACGRISSVKDISWPRRSWRKAAHRAAAIPSREPAHLQPPRSSITSARTPFIRASPRTLRRARRRRRVQRST